MAKKTPRRVYLYPDGHADVTFGSGALSYVELHEKWIKGTFSGLWDGSRLSIEPSLARVLSKAKAVTFFHDNATPAAKERGIRVSSLEVCTRDGTFTVHNLPSIMAGDFTIHEIHDDPPTFEEAVTRNRVHGFPVEATYRVEARA